MFEIDPEMKVEMIKKHKMKQMLRKVKRDRILQGIKGAGQGKVKIPNENETIKILEVLGHV